MDISKIANLREEVRKELSKKRYEHTLGVAYTAAALSFIYNEDPEKALIAGLLHDIAKCRSVDEQVEVLIKAGSPPGEELLKAPKVIHAKAGEIIARDRYHVTDADILSAISYHTTARAHMSTLEKIIFIADYIEPTRDEFPNLSEIRKLAFKDLDVCLYRGLVDTLERLNERGQYIHSDTIGAFRFYGELRLI